MATELVYWDSCVFISLLEQRAGRYEACEQIREKAARGELLIVTSTLALAETCRIDKTTKVTEEQSKIILAFFKNPFISVRPLIRPISIEAHQLGLVHGLMPNDAVHLATAIFNKVPVVHTYDGGMKKKDRLFKMSGRVGNPVIRILEPPPPGPPPPPTPKQQNLFGKP